MSRTDIVAAVSTAVGETGLDHRVLIATGLPHPAQVTVADTLRARAMMRAAAVQTVTWRENREVNQALVAWLVGFRCELDHGVE